jgi:gliding motility-associated-like protein
VAFRADLAQATLWCELNALLLDLHNRPAAHVHHAHPDAPPGSNGHSVTRHHALRLRFINGAPAPRAEGLGVQRGAYNYMLGNDPSRWARAAHAFSAVHYHEVWPGIDVRARAGERVVKYDLLLAPHADADIIALRYEGADAVTLEEGRLRIRTSLGDLVESIPEAFQEVDGRKRPVECTYVLEAGTVRFALGPHDATLPVTIDPSLVFSTFSGSFADNFGYTATYDNKGFLYSGSTAFGQAYPTTVGAYDTVHAGGDGLFDGIDIALTKYDTTGTFLIWSTFIGGSSDELPHSLVVNANDELFMLGTTGSADYPTTPGAFDTGFNGGPAVNLSNGLGCNFPSGVDMVLSRLSADGGQLLASTFVGGTGTDGLNRASGLKFNYADEVRGEIELDVNDNVYVASSTTSTDLPATPGAFRTSFQGGAQDGLVLKMDASLSTLFWCTYFGGSEADAAYALDRDDLQHVYICGGTRSSDLPFTTGFQNNNQGGTAEGFIAELRSDGTTLLAGTYYGSEAYDQTYFVEHDEQGNRFVFGQTSAPAGALIQNAPYNIPSGGQLIAKFSPGLDSRLMASRVGSGDGSPDLSPVAFLVDYCDKIYICGWGSAIQGGTLSTSGLPVTADAFQPNTDGNDFYLGVFDIDMTALFYATYIGGPLSSEHVDGGTSRFDRRGRIYESVCAGCGGNSDFPTTAGAWSATNNSGLCNNAVFKFDFDFPIVVAGFTTELACLPAPVQFNNTSSNATGYAWDFGDGTTSTAASPAHVFPGPGVYVVTLSASNPGTCNQVNTTLQQVVVLGNSAYALNDTSVCAGTSVQIGLLPVPSPEVTYQWSPTTGLSDPNVANPIATPAITTVYTLLISDGTCTDTVTQVVQVALPVMQTGPDTVVCGPTATVELIADSDGQTDLFHWSSNSAFTDQLNAPPTDSTATVTLTGDAWFHVRSEGNGCPAQDSVFIDMELIAPGISDDQLICADETATLAITGVEPGSDIDWQPAAQIDAGQGTTNVVVSPPTDQSYTVNVTSPAGCTWSASTNVFVSPLFGSSVGASVDQSIVAPGTTVQLGATPTTGVTYAWQPDGAVSDPTIGNPTAVVEETTAFILTISDGICTRNDTVIVTVYETICGEPDIFIPDAFTPDGDGNNDILYVRGRNITAMELKVFDRWGELVFSTTRQGEGWDATFKGQAVDPDVYVYWLDVTCGDGQTFFKKGNVTVIR